MSTLEDWFTGYRANPHMEVYPISPEECEPWGLVNAEFSRPDFRFFSVSLDSTSSLRIRQPEIGILGFLITNSGNSKKVLIQAKAEPGNIALVQLAPTVQATQSNFDCVHGGRNTEFLDFFSGQSSRLISSSLQSEHAAVFWRKVNRNMVVLTDGVGHSIPGGYAFFDVDELLDMLHQDYAVNTDARSVLASAPWGALVNRQPFSRVKSEFSENLAWSWANSPEPRVTKLLRELKDRDRRDAEQTELVGFQTQAEFDEWKWADSLRFVKVETSVREVPIWTQPLLHLDAEETMVLLCRNSDLGLEFLLSVDNSSGYRSGPEFTYSLVADRNMPPPGDLVARISQSDEGGRFWRSISHYEVRFLQTPKDEHLQSGRESYWVSLAELAHLAGESETCSNELRTLISMLLYWL